MGIPYGRFGTTYRFHLQGTRFSDSLPLNMGPIGCPETSVRDYHYSLRNNREERSSSLSSVLFFTLVRYRSTKRGIFLLYALALANLYIFLAFVIPLKL